MRKTLARLWRVASTEYWCPLTEDAGLTVICPASKCCRRSLPQPRGKTEVYVDSGVRRGSDVLKALALGATAVAVGRPLFWGLAVNGAQGVHHMLELLREEFDRAMGYCGQHSVDQLEDRLTQHPA